MTHLRLLAALGILACILAACAPAVPQAVPAPSAAAPAATSHTARPAASPVAGQSKEAVQTAQSEAFAAVAPRPSNTPAPAPKVAAVSQAKEAEASPAPSPEAATAGAGQAVSQQASMREEAFLAGPPAYAIMNRCEMPGQNAPALSATWTASLDVGLLCLFGFRENEVVRYEVRDAAGELVVADEGTPDNLDGDPLPSVKVMVSIANNAPGTWTVNAVGTTDELSAEFGVQPVAIDGAPGVVITLSSAGEPVRAGGEITVTAYGLQAGGSVEAGVYDVVSEDTTGSNLRLHEAATLEVSPTGEASVTLTLDPSYRPGQYCIVMQADPAYEPSRELSPLGATRCFEVQAE